MDPIKPSLDDLQRAFAVTSLEPELSDETLIAYASGRATDLEKDLVESMLEVDPTIAWAIDAIREELATVTEPLASSVAASRDPKRSGWLGRWLPAAGAIAGLAACGVLVFGLVIDNRALQDERSKSLRLASDIQANQQRVADLQQRLSTERTDRQRLVAELEKASGTLKREQIGLNEGGVDSLVAHALTRGLSMPAMAEIPALRGAADLEVSMTPNRTSVRLPVKLSWSGPRQGDYFVEIVKGEQEIWNARVSQSNVTPPKGLLEPGEVYAWRVASNGKRSSEMVFRVFTRKQEIQANRIAHDQALGPLEKGVAYASLGLITEAKEQFDLLRSSDPSLANRLIKEIENYQRGPG